MEQLEKKIQGSIDKIETLFKDKYYEVKFDHISVDKAVVKTIHNEKGYYFEFAKMVLTSQKDAHKLFDSDDETIEFSDFYTKIYFKINQCKGFNFSVNLSGSTNVKGYIKGFTTNHIEENKNGYYRAIIITKEKFTVSRYFFPSKSLKVRDTIYGSGIIDTEINNICLQLYGYDDKVTRKNYFIIETTSQCNYQNFLDIIDDIILSITYLTGIFLGNSVFVLGSKNDNFEKNDLLCLKSFYEDLKDGLATIPEIHFQRDIVGIDNIISPKLIATLTQEISKNLIYKRTILLLCQAHTEPHYIKASLYSVALETITNLIFELIETKHKPIQDKTLAKQIRDDLALTLANYKTKISIETFEKFSNDINRLNSLTNKQKLLLPFTHFGCKLPPKDIDAIEKRNDFLHGRIPDNADRHYLPIIVGRLLFCVNYLTLKYIGFTGYIFYPATMYQFNNKLEIDEKPLRRI